MNSILNGLIKNKIVFKNTRQIFKSCQVASAVGSGSTSKLKGKNGHYDIIIIGGGPAGLTMAGAIATNSKLRDKKVLVLDGAPKFKGYNECKYGNRVFSINEGTVDLMKSIDAWNTICSIRIQPVKQMQVWDALSDAYITFNHIDFNKNVAHVVENDVMLHAVTKQIEKNKNVSLINKIIIDHINVNSQESPLNSVKLSSGEEYSCELLIGADGTNSLVRKAMGIDTFSLKYDQMGLIATVELRDVEEANNVAWQRFLPDGVLALLPLNNSLSSIVWCSTTENIKKLLALKETEFIDSLNNAFWKKHETDPIVNNVMKSVMGLFGQNSRRGPLPPNINKIYEESRAAFPLGFNHSPSYVANGVALIGDAAHRVHPLAGQGLNLGFGDVKTLTDVLATASYDGALLSDLQYLCTYEQERLKHNVPIMFGIHGLQRLYNTDFSPIVLLRSIGLQVTQSVPPLKKMFMERAMY